MYVCMYVCMYVLYACMYVCMYVCMELGHHHGVQPSELPADTAASASRRIPLCGVRESTYVCMCMYIDIYIYIYVNTHIHVCAQVRRYEILFLWYSAFYTRACTPLLQVSGLMHVLLSKYRHRYTCDYLHHYFAFVFVRLYLYVSTSKGIICKGIYLSLGTSFNHPHM